MKVLLFDLDLHPLKKHHYNLALMKLSAYHKARGDEVFLNFPLAQADRIYASCIFTWNAKHLNLLSPRAIIGGSGIDLESKLPPEIEHTMPDYSLYDLDYSVGFTSRGCIRRCPWCVVPEKEGGIKPWASIYEFWDRKHKKIVLLDNNFLAAPNWGTTIVNLIKERVTVDFNQGLDIRLVGPVEAHYLSRVKAPVLRFSFDHPSYEPKVREGIERLLKQGIHPRKLSFYVLVGFNTTLEEDIERFKLLESYNVEIYPMVYRDKNGKEPKLGNGFTERINFHGSLQNRRRFLRLAGQLP